jgi:hypothetical protein
MRKSDHLADSSKFEMTGFDTQPTLEKLKRLVREERKRCEKNNNGFKG